MPEGYRGVTPYIAVNPVADQFYGDRAGTLVDPFGHRWTLATRIEHVSAEEAERRMREHAAAGS